jgi:hypothetical protein
MKTPAEKKRGGDADVHQTIHEQPGKDRNERALEEALEETMAGSDPVSITQPGKNFTGAEKPTAQEIAEAKRKRA